MAFCAFRERTNPLWKSWVCPGIRLQRPNIRFRTARCTGSRAYTLHALCSRFADMACSLYISKQGQRKGTAATSRFAYRKTNHAGSASRFYHVCQHARAQENRTHRPETRSPGDCSAAPGVQECCCAKRDRTLGKAVSPPKRSLSAR